MYAKFMASVSTHSELDIVNSFSGSYIAAKELVTKHTDAEKFLGDAKGYLEKVESSIPDLILKQWIAEEAEWLSKVVDISNHKGLDNPFTSPKDDGTLSACLTYLSYSCGPSADLLS